MKYFSSCFSDYIHTESANEIWIMCSFLQRFPMTEIYQKDFVTKKMHCNMCEETGSTAGYSADL